MGPGVGARRSRLALRLFVNQFMLQMQGGTIGDVFRVTAWHAWNAVGSGSVCCMTAVVWLGWRFVYWQGAQGKAELLGGGGGGVNACAMVCVIHLGVLCCIS